MLLIKPTAFPKLKFKGYSYTYAYDVFHLRNDWKVYVNIRLCMTLYVGMYARMDKCVCNVHILDLYIVYVG